MAAKTVTFKLPENGRGGAGNGSAAVALPKTPHPKKLEGHVTDASRPQPELASRPQSVPARHQSSRPQDSELRPHSRPSSEQTDNSARRISAVQSSSRVRQQRRDHVMKTHHNREKLSGTVEAINSVRERTNSASRDGIRTLKYSVVKLRESLLRVEEEIKQMTRGKNTLELAVQEVRKAISVNQQSLCMQQKKTRSEMDSTMRLLREESHVLSKSKSQVEQYLRNVKSHLQSLDSVRRALQTKISTLSQSLQLDAQSFKMYNGRREIGSACAAPGAHGLAEDTTAPIRSRAVEAVSASKGVRGGIEGLIVSIHTQRTQAHNTVTTSVAQRVQEANTRKREMLLERGQMRLSQNSAQHQQHTEKIMLGRILGPVSDKHRSVSEKEDRPLSRRRPGSSLEERTHIKKNTRKLTKRLSASALQVSEMEQADHHLSQQLKHHRTSASLDSHTLRIRKMSLDNRWVQ